MNPNATKYKNYGGRGITVCARWGDFGAFLADMGPKPGPEYTLDRIDSDGPYSPENCRWATPAEQAVNQRTRKLSAEDQREIVQRYRRGSRPTMYELAAQFGVSQYSIWRVVHNVRGGPNSPLRAERV